MKITTTSRVVAIFVTLALILSTFTVTGSAAPATSVTFAILHTNDFHGQLEASNADPMKASNPGMARVANVINTVRTAKGTANVLLVDVGDEMQGSLLSNLGDGTPTGKGFPTIATYNALSYQVATFGNHEFDWGQDNLAARTLQAAFPYVTANIVKNDTGNCGTAGWEKPDFADAPYQILEVGAAPNIVKVAFIGVTTTETPTITIATATAGLCFKDPATSILHYYDQMKSDGADVIVVLSHLGYLDGGYGYGIPVYGDQTLATKLNAAGKPVNLILGGHSHTNLTTATTVGSTKVVQAYYNGRNVGEADVTVTPTGDVSVNWKVYSWKIPTAPATTPFGWKMYENGVMSDFLDATQDTAINTLITGFASDPAYLAIVNQPIGYSAVDLPRNGGTLDNMMGNFVDDAIYNYLNTDGEPANDIDIFFNNAGGIRTDWCWSGTAWTTSGCTLGLHDPALLNYGNMFTILPFGNATIVGDMTGAQIQMMLDHAPQVSNGVIQPSGLKFKYYAYKDANPGPQPFAWGTFDVTVYNKGTHTWEPLDMTKTYKVGTNEFLAPAGGDGYNGFKYMTNITYWGDMLNAVDAYVTATYGDAAHAYMGPNNDGTLDDRIIRDGTDVMGSGSIIPITILHNNDSHGNLAKGTYVGYTQLASVIKQEKLHNPSRTILLNAGDQIQGDSMMYYFKSAPLGYASDLTPLPLALQTHPMMAVMNSLGYDAMTLGNHEFNFGKDIFTAIFKQANFHLLGANVADDGSYGLSQVGPGAEGVQPYFLKTVDGIKVAIVGITNHRVPNYELPSNIVGLTFSDPIVTAQTQADNLRAGNDVVLALTHIGFTEDPKSVEVDKNVDTNMAMAVSGLDAIIGSHSHTSPVTGFGAYKFLPTIVGGPNNTPVLITQAYRYNNYLGEVIIGVRAKAGGGYEVVSRTGQYIAIVNSPTATPEDADTKAIVDPYVTQLNFYNNQIVGQTTVPIDTLQAFTQETNGANLQADAAVYELEKHGIDVDFHLSGAMTNKAVATAGPYPFTLKVSDMFTLMPYENSLVVMRMNGPQLKAVLERAYRNYYYYKYVPGYGGYSYYTTCMIDVNSIGKITYNDLYPAAYDPTKQYVVSLEVDGHAIDFTDAGTYYKVSTVNYLAAGSCNFNDGGVTLWPLSQIENDTQYYVRDAVINYITAQGMVSPAIEGRLNFITDTMPPVINIVAPEAKVYQNAGKLTLNFTVTDDIAGVKWVDAALDGNEVANGQTINLYLLAAGSTHTLNITAMDKAYNEANASVTFTVETSIQSMMSAVTSLYKDGQIKADVYKGLMDKLQAAAKNKNHTAVINLLNAFISQVKAQSGKGITSSAATLLINDAQWLIAHLK